MIRRACRILDGRCASRLMLPRLDSEEPLRSEEQMMELILGFARERDDVRAVVLTGSRANPAAARDPLQDHDITFLVEDVAPYRRNAQVPEYFRG